MITELFEDCLHINPSRQITEALKLLPTCKGVILFTDDDDRPIQLLTAANIRRSGAVRLFGQPLATGRKRANISEIVRKICFCKCYNDFRTRLRHYQIARVLYPDSYRKIVALGRQSYVTINLDSKWPFFSLAGKFVLSSKVTTKAAKVFGPFPSRTAAGGFIQILQDAFGLCQRPKLIESGQKAVSCAYLQMDSCPGPCVGKISKEEYLEQINKAIWAAGGSMEEQKTKLQNRMEVLAEQREFEQAQAVKKQLDRLVLLAKEDYRWTRELSELTILHIDRSAKIVVEGKRKKVQRYSAFLIRSGHIIEFDDFVLENIGGFYKSLLEHLTRPVIGVEPKQLIEQLSLTAYFLYRSKPPGVWIDLKEPESPPGPEELTNVIAQCFQKAKNAP